MCTNLEQFSLEWFKFYISFDKKNFLMFSRRKLLLPKTLFHQRIKSIIAYQILILFWMKDNKTLTRITSLLVFPQLRAAWKTALLSCQLRNMVYILIYKTSLTIEDSFCVQERVRIFIASQLKNLISKVSNIGMQSCTYSYTGVQNVWALWWF